MPRLIATLSIHGARDCFDLQKIPDGPSLLPICAHYAKQVKCGTLGLRVCKPLARNPWYQVALESLPMWLPLGFLSAALERTSQAPKKGALSILK